MLVISLFRQLPHTIAMQTIAMVDVYQLIKSI